MTYHWNWSVLITQPYTGWLLSGLGLTLLIACAAGAIAFMLGSVVGILSTLRHPIWRAIAIAYVEFFRNIPLLYADVPMVFCTARASAGIMGSLS